MEIFIYMFDTIVALLAVYWVIAASKRKEGTAVSGLFAYRDTATARDEPPTGSGKKGRLASKTAARPPDR